MLKYQKWEKNVASEASGPQNGEKLIWVEIENYLDMGENQSLKIVFVEQFLEKLSMYVAILAT